MRWCLFLEMRAAVRALIRVQVVSEGGTAVRPAASPSFLSAVRNLHYPLERGLLGYVQVTPVVNSR
jgi:hypothetical protein